jgi:hypothetical protein
MTTPEKEQLADDGLDFIFRNARTHNVWLSSTLFAASATAMQANSFRARRGSTSMRLAV